MYNERLKKTTAKSYSCIKIPGRDAVNFVINICFELNFDVIHVGTKNRYADEVDI